MRSHNCTFNYQRCGFSHPRIKRNYSTKYILFESCEVHSVWVKFLDSSCSLFNSCTKGSFGFRKNVCKMGKSNPMFSKFGSSGCGIIYLTVKGLKFRSKSSKRRRSASCQILDRDRPGEQSSTLSSLVKHLSGHFLTTTCSQH